MTWPVKLCTQVTQRFQDAAAARMSVFRMFASGGSNEGFLFEPKPGVHVLASRF